MLFKLGSAQFDQTVRAYSADLYRYAWWLCRDRFTAEELVQETFARAWKNWDSLADLGAVKAWLITILRNERARLYERKRLDISDDDPQDLELPSHERPGDHLELEQLVGELPPAYREPLVLQVLGGYDCREIAEMLGTTEGAVMTRLTRARQALRAHLSEPAKARVAP
ncbi:MAG: sigma-70 family RNA polymerase sigma factor [Zoogloeaceae bacterium]|jgi:RNA polymerase sigma-70 factor (ECF subfamily)|nr:sigma-70 family RNA polymerase sigma factor [Zoogloeaceae bacterium]MBL8504558.1 sigma-70 family RNA polymerase sigma factor [Rhodocyclaceae bacterium]MCK6384691.1 sigma-70 family RNA polymerase sigma factor [Rhodocyclaceae bacterium]